MLSNREKSSKLKVKIEAEKRYMKNRSKARLKLRHSCSSAGSSAASSPSSAFVFASKRSWPDRQWGQLVVGGSFVKSLIRLIVSSVLLGPSSSHSVGCAFSFQRSFWAGSVAWFELRTGLWQSFCHGVIRFQSHGRLVDLRHRPHNHSECFRGWGWRWANRTNPSLEWITRIRLSVVSCFVVNTFRTRIYFIVSWIQITDRQRDDRAPRTLGFCWVVRFWNGSFLSLDSCFLMRLVVCWIHSRQAMFFSAPNQEPNRDE